MLKYAFLFLSVIFVTQAQTVPSNCYFSGTITSATRSTWFDNHYQNCNRWTVTYTSTGITGLMMYVDSAADTVPVAFYHQPGSPVGIMPSVDGSNPATKLNGIIRTVAGQPFSNYQWVSLNVITFTGSGSISFTAVGTGGSLPSNSTSSTMSRLRKTATDAFNANPFTSAPLGFPQAWTATTAYTAGTVLLATNANPVSYYLVVSATCTSGASTPTSVAPQAITDGTCTEYYYKPNDRPGSNSPAGPTITSSASVPGGLTNSYLTVSSTTGINLNYTSGILTPKTCCTGDGRYLEVTTTVPSGGNVLTTKTSTGANIFSFVTDAPTVFVQVNAFTLINFIVNGQFVTWNSTLTNNTNQGIVLTFASRMPKNITVIAGPPANIQGVFVDPGSFVSPQYTGDQLKMVAIGDSLLAGGNNFPVLPWDFGPEILAYKLGISVISNQGLGGTGYNNAGSAFTFAQRFSSDIAAVNPDIVLIFGGQNDSNTNLAVQVQQYLAQVRSIVPNALIILLGRWPAPGSGGSAGANVIACEQAIAAGYAAWTSATSDTNNLYIPIVFSPTGSPLTGTGNISAPTGSGTADTYVSNDGIHPTENGRIWFYGSWLYQQILKGIMQGSPITGQQ